MIEGKPRCVVIANGVYVKLPMLDRAVSDAEELKTTLESKHQYPTEVLPNFKDSALLKRIKKHLGKDALVDGSLIVVWIGHGAIGDDRTLRMLVRSDGDDEEVAKADDLGEWAARTGARQILVVIDTCYSGEGAVGAARLADAVISGRVSPEKTWFGAIAASLKDEPARSGALVREMVRLLREGPQETNFRWNKTRPYITGADFLDALTKGWSEPRQHPLPVMRGYNWDLVRNPLFEPGIPDQPIEDLLLVARGGSGDESYFTGREYALLEIVKRIGRTAPGLLVLTGPPGCGKSSPGESSACHHRSSARGCFRRRRFRRSSIREPTVWTGSCRRAASPSNWRPNCSPGNSVSTAIRGSTASSVKRIAVGRKAIRSSWSWTAWMKRDPSAALWRSNLSRRWRARPSSSSPHGMFPVVTKP